MIPAATITDSRVYRHFDTFAEFAEAAEQTKWCRSTAKTEGNAPSKWRYGNWQTRTRFMEAMREGRADPSVIERAERVRIECSNALAGIEGPTRRRRRVWGEEGDEVDTARMLANNPAPWSRTIVGRTSPVVRILAMFDGNAYAGPEQFAAAAAAVALAADALTTAGYSFEVWAIQHGRGGYGWNRRKHTITACIKGAAEPLDIHRVASVYTPGALRYLGFGLIYHDMTPDDVGSCITPGRETLELCSATGSIRPEDFHLCNDAEIVAAARRLIPT